MRPSLERRVLDVLWQRGECSVRDVLEDLGTDHAYTTILTVLQRLHAKKQVTRRRHGQALLYKAAQGRAEAVGTRAAGLLTETGPPEDDLLVAFLDSADARQPGLLDRLEELLRDRRRQPRGRRGGGRS